MTDARRIVVYYTVWATICAAMAGSVVAVIHVAFFSGADRSTFAATLGAGLGTALALAAGQGVVALGTGILLAQLSRTLHVTVLLGLAIGLFDFVMYFLQMAVPVTELGWVPDIVILTAVTILITALGAKKTVGQETPRR